jgi:tetrahydromethanopterin S-methyltransferase subunit G
MNIELANIALHVLNIVGTAVVGVWVWWAKNSDKTNERIDGIAARLEELDKAIRAVKAESGGHLRHTDLEKVYDRLNGMDGKLNQMIGEFRSHNDTLKLLLNKITEKGLS